MDKRFQGQRLGSQLIFDVLVKAHEIAERTALHGVILDAMNEPAARLYEQLGFLRLSDQPNHFFMPIGTIRASYPLNR